MMLVTRREQRTQIKIRNCCTTDVLLPNQFHRCICTITTTTTTTIIIIAGNAIKKMTDAADVRLQISQFGDQNRGKETTIVERCLRSCIDSSRCPNAAAVVFHPFVIAIGPNGVGVPVRRRFVLASTMSRCVTLLKQYAQ
jgi:hypothetical protein